MKAAFFDIDGTLYDRNKKVPESTREAIRKLKENGIYVFICSGRTNASIKDPALLGLGFDGIISGCGTYVSFRGEEFVYETIPQEIMKKTVDIVRKYEQPPILQGKEYHYMDKRDFWGASFETLWEKQNKMPGISISEHSMRWEVSKFVAFIRDERYINALEELSEWYDTKVFLQEAWFECVPKGFSKATGIQTVCEKLGIAYEDTYAFGDSINDLEMLEYVANGIVMGNGMEEAKKAADYVTDPVTEDGIYNACKHFHLI